jgi:two-component system, OmpR family, sensor histidine kinase KdpD
MPSLSSIFVGRKAAWIGYAVAIVVAGLLTACVGVLQGYLQASNLSVLYLLAVLAVAVAFGRWPAIVLSLAAFLSFNWFFVEPLHSFTVARPEEWVALSVFLVVAIITSELAAGQRLRAQEAEQREREAEVLYDLVRLMSEPDMEVALYAVAERLQGALGLAAVAIELTDPSSSPTVVSVGEPGALQTLRSAASSPYQLLGSGQTRGKGQEGGTGRWVRIVPPFPRGAESVNIGDRLHAVTVKAGEAKLGMVLLLSAPDRARLRPADDRLLSAVAAQLGQAFERRRLRREATEAEILRRTDDLKTALLNAVSHNLRTPLASIIASAGSLLQSDVAWSETERQEFAQGIDDEARRLNRIVANLLNISRIKSGNLQPEKGWYDLGALVDDVLGRLHPLTARHRVVADVQEDLPPVLLDYVEIDQVLSNLVENAAKYAPAGTEIRVCARLQGMEVQVDVADEGPGIPAAQIAELFEPFSRPEGVRPREKGAGLGLAVARGLVEAHGGRIWFQNLAPRGALFAFTLPAVPIAEPGEDSRRAVV